MKHLLNISKINGAEIEPVDVITFGSPCQDMSVAGKREGMKHAEQGDEETTRSGLFFEAIRIIKEMRESTNGEYPKYAVYENVPGAFSSNKGRDFHAVLESLCSVCDDTVSIPEPYDTKRTKLVWHGAGEIVGDGYSVAWRTLDAQYWGVPQRRKRIYLVADFTGRRAGEILFKPEGLRGDLPQSNETGQEVTTDAVGSVDGSSGVEGVIYEPASLLDENWNESEIKNALRANASKSSHAIVQPVIALQANGIDRADTAGCNGCGWRENESYTLNMIDRHAVCYQEKIGALQARDYKGVGNQYVGEDKLVVECYDARGNGDGETACTITGDHQNRITDYTAVAVQKTYTMQRSDEYQECNVASTQSARQYKSATDLVVEKKRKYIIRRLTPTECARLQGFPDWWGHLAPYNPADAEFWEDVRKTHAEINGKKYKPAKNLKKWYDKLHTDSAEYKMWGNGIALPNAEYVIRGIAEQGAKTLGSLFDGSGGFPLAGVMNGIKPLWASEVEPYPIAVTKSRFEGV